MKTTVMRLVTLILVMSTFGLANSLGVMNGAKKAVPGCAGNMLNGQHSTAVRECAVDMAIEMAAVPTAVSIASAAGITATTGTAIASLSGAAATSATLAGIGSGGATALGVVGIAAAPVVVGGVIVVGIAAGVAWGVNSLIDLW